MGVKLTFLGGMNQIGGNMVLLEDTGFNVKIIIDFGIHIAKYYQIFPRDQPPQSISELINSGILPDETQTGI